MTQGGASEVSRHRTEISAGAFEVQVVGTNGTLTAHLLGELDATTAPGFEEQLTALQDQGARQVVLDLGGLSFIDSSGLSALVSTFKRYRSAGGDVVLRSPTRATAKVLEICGLTQVFTIEGGAEAPDPQLDGS